MCVKKNFGIMPCLTLCILGCKTRRVSFDIKFTRQGFEKHVDIARRASRCQHAFSKPCLVNLISKGTWYSIYQFTHCFTLQTSDYDISTCIWMVQKLITHSSSTDSFVLANRIFYYASFYLICFASASFLEIYEIFERFYSCFCMQIILFLHYSAQQCS